MCHILISVTCDYVEIYNFTQIQRYKYSFSLPSTNENKISFHFFSCQKSGGAKRLNDVFSTSVKIYFVCPHEKNKLVGELLKSGAVLTDTLVDGGKILVCTNYLTFLLKPISVSDDW